MAEPKFKVRKGKKKVQVRFFADPELYESFVHEATRHDLFLQDVFHELMTWFVQRSETGKLEVRSD